MDKDKVIKLTEKGYITLTGMFNSDGELVEKIANMEEAEFLRRYLTKVGLYDGSEESGDVTYTYDTPEVYLNYSIVPAEGGTITPSYTYTQTWTGSDGSTGVISEGGDVVFSSSDFDVDPSSGAITINDVNEDTSSKTLGSVTLEVTLNEMTGSTTVEITQSGAGEVEYTYSAPVVTLEYPVASAKSGKISPIYAYSQTWTGSDGSAGEIENVGGILTFSSDDLTVDSTTGEVTYNTNTNTSEHEIGTVVLEVEINDMVGSATATVMQEGDVVTYNTPEVSLEYPEVPAEGGTIEPTYSYTQTYTTATGLSGSTSGSNASHVSGVELKFTSESLTVDESTGTVVVDANDKEEVLTLGDVTLEVTMNDVAGSGSTTLTQAAAEVVKTSVTSIEELKEALENGATYIVIDADLTASESISVTSDVTIDINGHTLTRDDDTSACAMFIVSGGTVEFTGSGTVQSNGTSTSDWVQGLWVNNEGATVNLTGDIAWKGGIWNNTEDMTTGSSACIYCEYGEVNIYTGSYECGYAADMKQYSVLNCLNSSYNNGTASINVYGGTFKNDFNPADNTSEGSNTNFVVEGYESIDNGDGTYTVISAVDPASISTLSTSTSSKSTKKSKRSKKS